MFWRQLAVVIGGVFLRGLHALRAHGGPGLECARRGESPGCAARNAAAEAFHPFFHQARGQFAHKRALVYMLAAAFGPVVQRGWSIQVKVLAGAGAGHIHEAALFFKVFGPGKGVA